MVFIFNMTSYLNMPEDNASPNNNGAKQTLIEFYHEMINKIMSGKITSTDNKK